MKNNNANIMNVESLGSNKLTHFVQDISASVHHFYLYGEITDDIKVYADLLDVLKTSSPNDVVMIYINSEGGILRMALQIANAMLSSQAKVVTLLEGEACSAATLIFLAGEEYIINPNCTFMIHNYSAGVWGKGHELQSHVDYRRLSVTKMMEDFYCKILTEEELEDVIKGRDIWMDSEELTKRLDAASSDNVVSSNDENHELIKRATKKKKKVTKKKAVDND